MSGSSPARRRAPAHCRARVRSDRGAALVIALMTVVLLVALGAGLILTSTVEARIARNFRAAVGATHAADAVLERALGDLARVGDWNLLLSGVGTSTFVDGPPAGARVLADGRAIDLQEVVNRAICQRPVCAGPADYVAVSSERPWGANNPRWRLFAYGRLDDLVGTSALRPSFYVVAMVGDDPSENDGDPLRDGASPDNPGSGILALRAEAFGPFGAHKVIDLAVMRTIAPATSPGRPEGGQQGQGSGGDPWAPGGLRVLSWREVRGAQGWIP
jgi:hypothetical protein